MSEDAGMLYRLKGTNSFHMKILWLYVKGFKKPRKNFSIKEILQNIRPMCIDSRNEKFYD